VDDFPYNSPDDFAPDDFRRTGESYHFNEMTKSEIADVQAVAAPKFQGDNFYKNKAIVEEIKKLAARKGCTLSQIALAWVASQGMIAIPGTTKAKRLEENWTSRYIDLSAEEKQEMRNVIDNAQLHGNRYAPKQQAMVGH
jgi:hypothetical protein